MEATSPRTVSTNGDANQGNSVRPTASENPIQKTERVQYVIPTSSIHAPVPGRDIVDVVNRSINSVQNIITEIKDVLRGVEADVRAIETITLIEETNKRTLSIQRRYRIIKDR